MAIPIPDQLGAAPTEGWRQRIGPALELLPKIAGLGGVAYICGLIVVQSHLQRFGVNRLGFFAPLYIAAGLWSFAFLFYCVGFGLLGFVLLRQTQPEIPALRNKAFAGLCLLVSAIIASLILWGLFLWPLGFPIERPGLVLTGVLVFISSMEVAILRSRLAGDAAWGPAPQPDPWLAILPDTLVLVTVGVVLFGKLIYPTVPARWGGGQPIQVKIVLKADAAGRLLRATILADTMDAVPGQLLMLTADEVLICLNGQARPMLLQRSDVSALVLEQSDTAALPPCSSSPPD